MLVGIALAAGVRDSPAARRRSAVENATKAVYQKPDPRLKEQPNICRKSPTQGSKAEPATCQNPGPDANRYLRSRRNFLPGVNRLASIGAAALTGRALSLLSPHAVDGGERAGIALMLPTAPLRRG